MSSTEFPGELRAPVAPEPRRPSLWQHGDFVRMWAGQTISLLGSQVTLLALPLTAILVFKASAFQVGVLSTVEFLPFMLLGLPVGVWVDRLRRRPILVAADVLRLIVIGSVPLAYVLGVLRLRQLYVVGFLSGIGTVFFDVAYGAYLPSLVDRSRIVEGNAKLEASRSGAQIAGPGLAGVLVQALTAPGAMLADALSYLASVVSLLSIRRKEPPVDHSDGGRPRMRRQVAEGIRFIASQPLLRPILACTGTLNLFSMMGQAVILLFAVKELGLSAGAIGVILSVGSAGFLVGALIAERVGRRLGVGPTLIVCAFLIGLGPVFIPLASRGSAAPMLILYGLIASFGGVIYNVNGRSLMQSLTPDRMLGRAIATNRFVVWGVIPIGTFVGGVLGSRIGLRPTLWIAAAGQLLAFLPPLLSPVRRLRSLPDAVSTS